MEDPVLHVIVVGFHHKKGCQVEFSFPPLIEGNSVESHEIPEEWKHIPSLALPDGAHNFVKDTVYFVLPGRKGNLHTVYGVSCYRQMDAESLINKTADVTRSSVQKSVVVLSRLPMYGLIKAKLELITHAYFDERDFSQVALLEQTFNNLNSSLTQSLLEGSQVFLGLSARDLVNKYKHKIIIIFKLLLLERRVLIYGSPVESLCHTLLSVLTLFPGMLETGLKQACNQWTRKKLSPTMSVANVGADLDETDQFMEIRYHNSAPETPLSEVMSHLGNFGDGDYASLNIGQQDTAASDTADHQSLQEAPESPTITRDPAFFEIMKSSKPESTGSEAKSESVASECSSAEDKKQDWVATYSCNHAGSKDFVHEAVSLRRSRSLSNSNDSDKLSVHSSHRCKKEGSTERNDKTEDKCDDKVHDHDKDHVENIMKSNETRDSPLAHIETITQIEAVQANVNDELEYFSISNNNDPETSNKKNLDLPLSDIKELQIPDELIDDLDSPESISRIDREDCFSWEQDRLQLSIDHVFNFPSDIANDSRHSSYEREKSVGESGSERESVSSDGTNSSTPTHTEKNQLSKTKALSNDTSPVPKQKKTRVLKNRLSAALHKVSNKSKQKDEKNEDKVNDPEVDGNILLPHDDSGYPLTIFTNGSVCYPYLCLQYHDILTDVNIRSFVIGATNVLFKQRRQLIDAIIEVEDSKVDIRDRELQRQLSLTTADLRFVEYLVNTVTEDTALGTYDGTEWEGSDEWIRAQFRHYLNSLLATVATDDPKLTEDFGTSFISAWKSTQNYHVWAETDHPAIKVFPPGHAFQGNLNMTDVRMRFNHTLQNSERGRKISAAAVQTGKYVAQTGRVVGGALTSARSAVSGWFSSWRSTEKVEVTESEATEADNQQPMTEESPDTSNHAN